MKRSENVRISTKQTPTTTYLIKSRCYIARRATYATLFYKETNRRRRLVYSVY